MRGRKPPFTGPLWGLLFEGAMAITWTDVAAMATELATVPIAAQNEILDTVNALQSDVWGNSLRAGQLALARHLGTIGQRRNGMGGSVVSATLGSASVTYASSSGSNGDSLASTSWGQEYERLLMALPHARLLVIT